MNNLKSETDIDRGSLNTKKKLVISTIKKIGTSILFVISTLGPIHAKEKNPVSKNTISYQKTKQVSEKNKPKNGLDRIIIHPNSQIEIARYKSYKSNSDLAVKNKNQLFRGYPKLLNEIDSIEPRQLFTLSVKESRLEFAKPNKSGAFGYAGLKPIAIKHVDDILQNAGVKLWSTKNNKKVKKYDPYKNKSDHLLYMHLYFGNQKKLLSQILSKVTKEDQFWFTVAAYNAGIGRVETLYLAGGKPKTRNELVAKINKKYLSQNSHPKVVSENSYGTKSYKDRFGGKNLNENKKLLLSGYSKNTKIATTIGKRYEIVRYVEMNKAIKNAVK